MKYKLIVTVITLGMAFPVMGEAQTMSDYLILNDIGAYKLDKPEKYLPGEPPMGGPRIYNGAGVVSGSGHFRDHKDTSYEVMYIGGNGLTAPTVTVVQHAGADSDQWLLHEIERSFRYGDYEEDMTPSKFRNIDGNNMFYSMLGGGIIAGFQIIRS